MYEYELQRLRTAELIRQAEHQRLVRQAVRAGRAARREAALRAAESDPHTGRPRRHRFVRTA